MLDRRLLVGLVLGWLTWLASSGCSEPRAESRGPEDESRSSEVAAPREVRSTGGGSESPERVDLHGEWKRWAETPRLRERALRELEELPRFGFGREASPEEIAAIDIDVMPDGTGLPPGSGSVARGRELYQNQCIQCHGADGRGADYEALVGRVPGDAFGFADDDFRHQPTVGNYWPYATTLYDYVHRAMPQAVPGSLPPDDVYSLVAYVLFLNDLLPEDGTLNQDTLPRIEMPARDRFVYDDREGGPELR